MDLKELLKLYQENKELGIADARLEKPYPPVDSISGQPERSFGLPYEFNRTLTEEGSKYGGTSGSNYRLKNWDIENEEELKKHAIEEIRDYLRREMAKKAGM